MNITPLGISVLALLNERPMHPYEMYQLLMERHDDRLVKVSPGSVYRTVERLTGDGHAVVTGTERQGNRPERTTYAITDQGREALLGRVREALRTPAEEYSEFALALSEAHNAAPAEVCADLRDRLARLDAESTELTRLIDSASERGVPEAYWIAGRYQRDAAVAERDWIATLIERIENEDLPWPAR